MWSRLPFVRIIIPFVIGIWCASLWNEITPTLWGMAGIGCLMVWLLPGRLTPGYAWRLVPLQGLAVLLCIATAGGLTLCGKRYAQQAADQTEKTTQSPRGWIITLEESPQRKQRSFRATAAIECLTADHRIIPAGRGLIYFQADTRVSLPGIGTRLITNISPAPLQGPEYPGGFDAAGYFGRQGINYRLFLAKEYWATIDSGHVPRLQKTLEKTRTTILGILRSYIRDREAVGLAEALLIGYRNDLDEQLSDAYAETGVIHVIAISGLHIGVIYGLLSGLLQLLLRRPGLRWLSTAVSLAGIWGFGMLAGGGPSVMRSVCMFSVIGIGHQITGRKGNGLNTLAAVAGGMLAVQPWWLWDLGFQLSFTAVAGLMLCYQPILALLPITNPLAVKGWEMIAVTLAAQILTTPLLLHTFGRFPLFFLITNIVAIPLSTIILLGELVLCLLSLLHNGLAEWCGTMLTTLIRWLNDYIFRMDSIEFGTLEDIHLSAAEMALIYLIIACLMGWYQQRHARWLMGSLFSITLLGFLHVCIKQIRDRQQILVIMPMTHTRLIMLIDGNSAKWLLTSFGPQDPRQISMALRATAHHFGIKRQHTDTLPVGGTFHCSWNGLNLLMLSRNEMVTAGALRNADILLISGNGPPQTERLMATAPHADWIADGTNKLWKIREWERVTERLPLRLISTRRSGAYIRRIR